MHPATCRSLALLVVGLLVLGGAAIAAPAGKALPIKLEKGQKIEFVVRKSSESTRAGRDGGDPIKTVAESTVGYSLEVTAVGDDGITASLSLGSARVKSTTGDRVVEFDGAAKAKDGEAELLGTLREALKAKHTVTIAKDGSPGRIESLAGLGGQRGGGFGGGERPSEEARDAMTVAGVFSQGSIAADLRQVLGAGLHDGEIEVGKTYFAAQPEGRGRRDGAGGGEGGARRGRGQGGQGGDSLFFQEGEGQERRPRGQGGRGGFGGFGGGGRIGFRCDAIDDAAGTASFTVMSQTAAFGGFRRGGDQGDAQQEPPAPKEIGKAVFSLKDGVLVSMKTEDKTEFGETFSRTAKVTIERKAAAEKKKESDL